MERIDGTDRHPYCVQCLGPDHAADAIYAPDCEICMVWSREYKLRRLAVASLGPTAMHDYSTTSSHRSTEAPRRYETAESGSHRPRSRERTPAPTRSTATKIAGGRASSSQAGARGPAPLMASASFSRPLDDAAMMEEEDDQSLSSFQLPRDVHMLSPRHRPIDASSQAPAEDDYDEDDDISIQSIAVRASSELNASDAGDDTANVASSSASKPEPVATTFRRAVERCGLRLAEEADNEPANPKRPLFPGETAREPKKPRAVKKLPVCPGLREALHSTWKDHENPAAFKFHTEMEDTEALGLARPPPVKSHLVDCFAGLIPTKNKNPYVTGDKPNFSDKDVKEAARLSGVTYERVAHPVKYCNATALLCGSMAKLLREEVEDKLSATQLQEMKDMVELMISLNAKTVEWLGHVLATLVRQDRKRWTGPLALKQSIGDIKKRLDRLDIAPDDLFPGGYELLKAITDEKKMSKEMVAAVSVPELPTVSPTSDNKPKKGRRSGSSGSGSVERPASTPPTPQGGRGRGEAGRARDDPAFLRPDPPRYYPKGRGRGQRK